MAKMCLSCERLHKAWVRQNVQTLNVINTLTLFHYETYKDESLLKEEIANRLALKIAEHLVKDRLMMIEEEKNQKYFTQKATIHLLRSKDVS